MGSAPLARRERSARGKIDKGHTNEALRTIPVLVFSASQADVDVHTAYSTHANGYIRKPSDLQQLYAIIDSIESFG